MRTIRQPLTLASRRIIYSPRFFRWCANAMFAVHVCLGIYYVVGWAFVEWHYIYFPLLIAWPFSWVFLGYCPLTKWELILRKQYDATIDTDTEKVQSFLESYFEVHVPPRVVYIAGITLFVVFLLLALLTELLVVA